MAGIFLLILTSWLSSWAQATPPPSRSPSLPPSLPSNGQVSGLLKQMNPWSGFHVEDPVLWVMRAEKIDHSSCQAWVKALHQDRVGVELKGSTPEAWKEAIPSWEPWPKSDLKLIQNCDDFPCKVKLNQEEVSILRGLFEENRFSRFLEVIRTRVADYEKTGARKHYEFPGTPVNPWLLLKERGITASAAPEDSPHLRLRILDLASSRVQPIRQVLDRREIKDESGNEGSVWIRDVYNDHYFDSWGEWSQVYCGTDPKKGESVVLVQLLIIELDLLKKNDIASRIMRGKMRSTIQEQGSIYLNKAFKRIQAAVKK